MAQEKFLRERAVEELVEHHEDEQEIADRGARHDEPVPVAQRPRCGGNENQRGAVVAEILDARDVARRSCSARISARTSRT